jgi:hypothetical protein
VEPSPVSPTNPAIERLRKGNIGLDSGRALTLRNARDVRLLRQGSVKLQALFVGAFQPHGALLFEEIVFQPCRKPEFEKVRSVPHVQDA